MKKVFLILCAVALTCMMSSCGDKLTKDATKYAKLHAKCINLENEDAESQATADCYEELNKLDEEMQELYNTDEETAEKFFDVYMEELEKCDLPDDYREFLEYMKALANGDFSDEDFDMELDDEDLELEAEVEEIAETAE